MTETKSCQLCKRNFEILDGDLGFYEKIGVPTPTFCPECRNQRRMSWRNERSLYKRQCNAPGHTESLISMYDPAGPYKVFDAKYWWSDDWDALSYGRDYDFSKPFFAQFAQLMKDIPLIALSNVNSVNSEYENFVAMDKNGYLCFGSGLNENCSYCNKTLESRDSQDLLMVTKGELAYECVDCQDVYKLAYPESCNNCTDSYFLYNCRDCDNCFGCTNLVSKSHCMFNEQLTKEEYQKRLKELDLSNYDSIQAIKEKFEKLRLKSIHKYSNIIASANCTGDNIVNAKNCFNCFDIFRDVEDSKFLFSAFMLKDSYDGNGIYKTQFSYEMVDSNESNASIGTVTVYNSTNSRYSFNCHSCQNIFGCVNLRSKNYCILNKQYSKEEYQALVPKIIEQMKTMPYVDKGGRTYSFGEFFPTEISPWAYNETISYEYFPLKKEEAAALGFAWTEPEKRNHAAGQDVIACEHLGKCEHLCTEAFKLTPQEINFYKKLGLPTPRLCSNGRHFARIKQRNPLKLWDGACQCLSSEALAKLDKGNETVHFHGDSACENTFRTPYPPEHPEILYCEQCYQKEVN